MFKATAALAASMVMVSAAGASAAAPTDPGRWTLAKTSDISWRYWQGHSSSMDSKGAIRFYYAGTNELYIADSGYNRTLSVKPGLPAAFTTTIGFNHIGDPSWDPAEGGRLLAGLECYYPSEPVANTCGVGAIASLDPASLSLRYAVKLDSADIKKAMWVESSPDGKLVWTSSGNDLLAYSASDIKRSNSFTAASFRAARPIHPVRRLDGAVPPSGVTGAAFWGGRLFLAGQDLLSFQVWSVDTTTGQSRLEIERTISGESEGLDVVPNQGGLLQWSVMPLQVGPFPRTWEMPTMMSFRPSTPTALSVTPSATRLRRSSTKSITFTVEGDGGPIPYVKVTCAGKSGWTGRSGKVTLSVRPTRKGSLPVTAALTGTAGGSATLTVS